MIMEELLSFFSGMLASIIANEFGNTKDKKKFDIKSDIIENRIMKKVNKCLKDEFEKESITDLIRKEQYNLKSNSYVLYGEKEKEEFIKNFYKEHNDLQYIGSSLLESIIIEYLEAINKFVNDLLSSEGKILLSTIKQESKKQNAKIDELSEKVSNVLGMDIQSNNKNQIVCAGYGKRIGKCNNILDNDEIKYCRTCSELEYYDNIKELYKLQKYNINSCDRYFIASISLGIVDVKILVIPMYTDSHVLQSKEIDKLIVLLNQIDNMDSIQHIHIVSTSPIDTKYANSFKSYKNLSIITEEDIISKIMDFSGYIKNIIREYESNPISRHFIDVYDENTDEPLLYTIKDFMNDVSNNAFLILGDYGCGKTSFLLNLAYKVAIDNITNTDDYIPIYIPLRDYTKAVSFDNLFLDFFANKCGIMNASIETFKFLLGYKKFVILFDGFDEVAKRVNYDVKFDIFNEICKFAIKKAKIIVTCRPNYFQERSEYEQLIENSHLQLEPNQINNTEFTDTYIAKLNEEQISAYINSYKDELSKEDISVSQIEYLINNTHDLMDLSERPFLLSIIIKTLPQIVSEIGNDSNKNGKINAAMLYKRYSDIWLDRENSKGKTLISKKDKLFFCQNLAFKMFIENCHTIHFSEFPSEIRKYFSGLDNIDEIDYFSHDIQSCSFLNSDGEGNFGFIHKSFMEYFVASILIEKIIHAVNSDSPNIVELLSIPNISSEVALFIKDILDEDVDNRDKIINTLVENFKNSSQNVKYNILTILSKMHYNIGEIIYKDCDCKNIDLSYSTICNTIITGVDFSEASFYKAKIQNVHFINCTFNYTYFQKCELYNVVFSGLDLEYADLSYSTIKKCDFSESLLGEVNLSNSIVQENDFLECDMSGSNTQNTMFLNNRNVSYALGAPYDMC